MTTIQDFQKKTSWHSFWFQPTSTVGLHAMRVFGGAIFLFWLLTFVGHQQALFGLEGWFDHVALNEAYYDLPEKYNEQIPAPIGWSIVYLAGSNAAMLNTIYWLSVLVVLLFTAGVATRITAILTYVAVASFAVANPAISYGADSLLTIFAFYLMLGYVFVDQWSQPQSLLSRLVGSPRTILFSSWWMKQDHPHDEVPSHTANLVLRIIQVHFAIIVFASGLHKLQFGEWWGGVALFFPLHPALTTDIQDVVGASSSSVWVYLFFLSAATYAVLAWQIGFPFFAWRKAIGWRILLLGGGAIAWIGCLVLGQPFFGPVFFLGCVSYLTASEWQTIRRQLTTIGVLPDSKSDALQRTDKPAKLKKGQGAPKESVAVKR